MAFNFMFFTPSIQTKPVQADELLTDEPLTMEDARNCREVIAIALNDENSRHWNRPRVLDVGERFLKADLSDVKVTAAIINALKVAVPNRERRYELAGDIMRAIPVAREHKLCGKEKA